MEYLEYNEERKSETYILFYIRKKASCMYMYVYHTPATVHNLPGENFRKGLVDILKRSIFLIW